MPLSRSKAALFPARAAARGGGGGGGGGGASDPLSRLSSPTQRLAAAERAARPGAKSGVPKMLAHLKVGEPVREPLDWRT